MRYGMIEQCPLCSSNLERKDRGPVWEYRCTGPTCSYRKVVKKVMQRRVDPNVTPLSYRPAQDSNVDLKMYLPKEDFPD